MKKVISIIMLLAIVLSVVAVLSITRVEAQLPLPPGVPRGDVLVVENHWGTMPDPYDWNFYRPGGPSTGGTGHQQSCAGYLWYINTTNSELINWLAAAPPEYSPDLKTLKIYIRKGLYWNDGVPFTAHDVVFHIKYLITHSDKLPAGVTHRVWVEDVYAEDDYTVVIKLKNPYPRYHYTFTVIIYGAQWILPKHVWEKVDDPLAFKNYPPVCIGPYNLKAVDTAGNWMLYERYEDWWGTKLYGMKPAPKYVLFIHHGPEDVKALAMSRHELDAIRTFLPENFEIVWKANPYIGGWRAKAPFAWPFDACVKGIAFNNLRYPFNITEVRKALVHAINYVEIWEAFRGADGSVPTLSVLPVVRIPVADKYYYRPLKEELRKLGLDPNPPPEVRKALEGIGLDPDIAWWKYDPELAENLLKSVGFTRGSDGKWRLPTGEPWVIHITAPHGFEMESQRIGFLVADQWKRFGVDVVVETVEAGVFSKRNTYGDFEVGTFWPGCTQIIDLGAHITGWNSKYFVKETPSHGWPGYQFPKRAELDSLLNQLEATPPWEIDKVAEIARKALLIWAEQLPWAGFFPTPFYTIWDGYCWENWPYFPENYYMDPVYWWAQMLFIILQVKPTGRCPTAEAVQPGKPPVLPVEKPAVTPTPAFVTVTVTATVASPTTVTATVTAAAATVISSTTVTVPTTVISTVVSTSPTTVLSTVMRTETTTVTVTDWTTTIVLAIVLLIIGFAIGYFIKRR